MIKNLGNGGAGGAGGAAISAGASSQNSGTIVFSNSNGITFGLNNGVLTATVTPGAAAGIAAFQLPNTTYTSGTVNFINSNGVSFGSTTGGGVTASFSSPGATVFSNSNNVSFGLAGSTVTASASIAATQFSNSNNVTFGLAGSTVTASASFAQTNQSQSNIQGIAAAGSTAFTGSVIFSNSNGVTFGLNGQTMTASVSPSAAFAISANGSSQNAGTLVFSNSNGVSFGMNGSTITATVTPGAAAGVAAAAAGTQTQTSGTLVFANSNGLTFGMSGSSQITGIYTVPGATVFSNSNNVSFGLAGSTVTASASFAGGAGGVAMSAGTQSVSTGTVVFSNSNGVSFGLSGSSRLTASVAAQTNQTLGVFASSQTTGQSSSSTLDARSLSFVGQGIISVGLSAGSVLFSAPATSAITLLSVGMSTGGNTVGTTGLASNQLVIAGGANITLSGSTNGGSMTISVIGGAGAGGTVNFSAGTTSGNLGSLVFSNANGVSFGLNGSTLTASAAGGGGGGSVNFSAGTTSGNLGSVVFSNANGVSFGLNGSTITASAAGGGISSVGLYALGNTTQNSSTTLDQRTMSFNGLGAMTVGFSAGSIQMSAPATSSISATGIVSVSVNGNTISIGAPAQGYTESGYNPYADLPFTNSQIGNGVLVFDPNLVPSFQYDRVLLPIMNSNVAGTSGSHSLSFWVGLYTRNVSTLSLLGSASGSTAVTQSGTNGSYSLYSGLRHFSIGSTSTLSAGRYWMGFVSSTSSAGGAGSYSNIMQNIPPTTATSYNFNGYFGVVQNNTQQFTLGQGEYSAATAGMPASVAFSQISGVSAGAQNQQFIMFASSTV